MAEEDRIRKEKYSLYLLPEEKAMLEACADEFDMTKAEYIRKLILYGAITGRQWSIDKEQGKELLYEVNKIGNNVNQIAYRVNVKKYTSKTDLEDLENNFIDLLKLMGDFPFLEEGAKEKWQQQLFTLLNRL